MNEDKRILLERASKRAKRINVENIDVTGIQVVEFLLFPENYAIASKFVVEVIKLKDLTSVPGTPPFINGIINFRGAVISIINLKSFFDLKEVGLTEMNKVLIVKNENLEFGIVVDEITRTNTIKEESLISPPINLSKRGSEFITGITQEGVILLDVEKMLYSEKMLIIQ